MRTLPLRVLALLAALLFPGRAIIAETVTVSDAQALAAGKRLWRNECGGTVEGLTSWNAGEDFASLGIGHYIWYPAGKRGPFEESFPELLRYMRSQGTTLPGWLDSAPACPWNSREGFLKDRAGGRLSELRELLAHTVALQARFSVNRLQAALPKMLDAVPASQRDKIRAEFSRLANAPGGIYALVDYVNFKGEGTLPTERYQGQGWGLLQVLAGMNASASGRSSTAEFAVSAARVLTQRVANAPAERHESRWLPGWKNRVQTYAN